jgi:hypothetical protein
MIYHASLPACLLSQQGTNYSDFTCYGSIQHGLVLHRCLAVPLAAVALGTLGHLTSLRREGIGADDLHSINQVCGCRWVLSAWT